MSLQACTDITRGSARLLHQLHHIKEGLVDRILKDTLVCRDILVDKSLGGMLRCLKQLAGVAIYDDIALWET